MEQMQTEQQRRQEFVEQIRRVLGDRLGTLSERQKGLLNEGLEELLQKRRPVTDAELEGEYEMITVYVSPKALEDAARVYEGLRRSNSENEGF